MPLEDGGNTVSHYIVDRRETSRLNWVVMETECKTLSCVSTKLIKNNEYIFRVRAVNKYGPGVPLESEAIIARNAYSKSFVSFAIFHRSTEFQNQTLFSILVLCITAVPTPPGAPEITAVGKQHVIIEWLKPESDGGSEIKNFLVDKREKSSVRWTRVNKTFTIYDTRLKITGLLEGSEYQFRVAAVNSAGTSLPSETSEYALCRDPTCE